MHEFAVYFALLASGVVSGSLLPLYVDLRRARRTLEDKVAEFADITKKASEANTSLAGKIMQFEQRIEALEFHRQASAAPQGGWKGK